MGGGGGCEMKGKIWWITRNVYELGAGILSSMDNDGFAIA